MYLIKRFSNIDGEHISKIYFENEEDIFNYIKHKINKDYFKDVNSVSIALIKPHLGLWEQVEFDAKTVVLLIETGLTATEIQSCLIRAVYKLSDDLNN